MISKSAQLRAVTHYEFLMHWRQRGLLISCVVLALLCLFMELNTHDSLLLPGVISASHEAKAEVSTTLLTSFQTLLHSFAILLLPIVVADSIPKDKQYRISELLNVYPLSDDVYLTGKILGMWLNVLVCLGSVFLLLGVSWWLIVYPFNIADYFGLWLVGVFPVALINAALSVLIASRQTSRRSAVLLGVAFAIICVYVMSAGLGRTINLTDVWNPGRPIIFKYYLVSFASKGAGKLIFDTIQPEQIAFSLAAAVIELVLVWCVVYWWMRRQDAK